MLSENKKWLKFHGGQYHLRFYLCCKKKLVPENNRVKKNQMKTERKYKSSYIEKTNPHVPCGWCVHSTFAYGCAVDPFKMCFGKDRRKIYRAH